MKSIMKPFISFFLLSFFISNPRCSESVIAKFGEETLGVVLIVDESGSMARNDPKFLRNTGLRLFTALLDQNDEVGIIRFSSDPYLVTKGMEVISSFSQQQKLLLSIQDNIPDGYTDIQKAVCLGAELIRESHVDRKYIVMLSDGAPEIYGGVPDDYAYKTVSCLDGLNVGFYGIALTLDGESNILYQLAENSRPNGRVINADSPMDIVESYMEIIADIKDRIIVQPDPTKNQSSFRFPLDNELKYYIDQATYVYVSDNSGVVEFMSPSEDGAEKILRQSDFILAKYQNPKPYEYSFENVNSNSYSCVIYRSRLRLKLINEYNIYPTNNDLKLEVVLEEDTRNGLVRSIGDTTISAQIVRPDGTIDQIDEFNDDGIAGDTVAYDGVFTAIYPRTEITGHYQILINGYKGTIPVSASGTLQLEKFPVFSFVKPVEEQIWYEENPVLIQVKVINDEFLSLPDSGLSLNIVSPSGVVSRLIMKSLSQGLYETTFKPETSGVYIISIDPVSIYYKNSPYLLQTKKEVIITIMPVFSFQLSDKLPIYIESSKIKGGYPLLIETESNIQMDKIQFELVGFSKNLILTPSTQSIALGEGSCILILQSDLSDGLYEGYLKVSSEENILISNSIKELSFIIDTPVIEIVSVEPVLGSIKSKVLEKEGLNFKVTIKSSSQEKESLYIQYNNGEQTGIDPRKVDLLPNSEKVFLVNLGINDPDVSEISGRLDFSARDGINVIDMQSVFYVKVIQPSWLSQWGGGGLLLLGTGLFGSKAIKKIKKQQNFVGQIIFQGDNGKGKRNMQLSSVRKRLLRKGISIGNQQGAGVFIDGTGVCKCHAKIFPVTYSEQKRIGNPSKVIHVQRQGVVVKNTGKGKLKVGNISLQKGQVSRPLRNGCVIQVGSERIQYRN